MQVTLLEPSDWSAIQEWLRDEDLIRQLAVEPPDLMKPILLFAIRLNDGTIVGWAELFNVDRKNHKAELGMAIPDPRGRGFSLRAFKHIQRIAFEELGLHRLTMRVLASNKLTLALLKHTSARQEGREKDACFVGDRYEDVIVFGLVKE